MKTQDFCPICGSEKIIQDSKHDEWICSNHHCMFHDFENVKAISDNMNLDKVVFLARQKCSDRFVIESLYMVPGNDFKQDIKVARSKHERYGNRFLK